MRGTIPAQLLNASPPLVVEVRLEKASRQIAGSRGSCCMLSGVQQTIPDSLLGPAASTPMTGRAQPSIPLQLAGPSSASWMLC